MRTVSGELADALKSGDLHISLLGHDRPYSLELAYRGIGSQKGQPVTLTLIKMPGSNPSLHPLLEFEVERVVFISLQITDKPPAEQDSRGCDDTTRRRSKVADTASD
ncbi:hypothetical protein [Lysobacter brunescens]|uniref:Uncharacterized protein n=1 Tax=Lysobacter brunescens TaxID=262323 RepID=A0ABW2YFH4_9GAMM